MYPFSFFLNYTIKPHISQECFYIFPTIMTDKIIRKIIREILVFLLIYLSTIIGKRVFIKLKTHIHYRKNDLILK